MILDRYNKFAVQVGDTFKVEDGVEYVVLNKREGKYPGTLSFSLQNKLTGFVLHDCASSHWYGAEVIKGANASGNPKNASEAFASILDGMDADLLNMSNTLGRLDAEHDKSGDSWTDVGSLNTIASKLAELKKELNEYAHIRLELGR